MIALLVYKDHQNSSENIVWKISREDIESVFIEANNVVNKHYKNILGLLGVPEEKILLSEQNKIFFFQIEDYSGSYKLCFLIDDYKTEELQQYYD